MERQKLSRRLLWCLLLVTRKDTVIGLIIITIPILILSAMLWLVLSYNSGFDAFADFDLAQKSENTKYTVKDVILINYSSDVDGLNNTLLTLAIEITLYDLPDHVLNTINDKDFPLSIVVIDSFGNLPIYSKMSEIMGLGKNTEGLYMVKQNKIIIAHGYDRSNDYAFTILHEIGHSYYRALGQQNFFEEISGKEKAPTIYGEVMGYREDFANTFALYFLNPKYLKGSAPLRYDRMGELLRQTNVKR